MGADASGAARFGAGAAHLDIGDALGEGDLCVVDFFGALDAGANRGAFAAGLRDPVPLDERARFLERGPAADFDEEAGVEFEHRRGRHGFRISQDSKTAVALKSLYPLFALK